MDQAPTPEDYEGFRGVVRHGTPGVEVGSIIELEPEADGWHIYVTIDPVSEAEHSEGWDVWCDDWDSVKWWVERWGADWHREAR